MKFEKMSSTLYANGFFEIQKARVPFGERWYVRSYSFLKLRVAGGFDTLQLAKEACSEFVEQIKSIKNE